MQIMPETASFMTRISADGVRGRLRDPGYNLDLGQRYVTYLATLEQIDGNLLRLLASYNAGPGSLARWAPAVRDAGDPLLFIESIPIAETRAYVARVLAYTWTYAARLRLPTPALDELAAGAWPRYHAGELIREPPARLH
jgi:soluble lytic murein transglycosylase-like protein